MIILYILGGIIAIFLMYILFLFVCSLFVRTDRQYMEDSRFYRHLLYGATGFAMWFLRGKWLSDHHSHILRKRSYDVCVPQT